MTSKSLTGLLGLLLLIFLMSFKFSTRNQLLILVLGLLFSFIVLFTENPINDRISRFIMVLTGDIDSLRLNESSYVRLYLVNSAIELAKEYPIFGVGINNAKYFIIWPMRDTGSFLHNTYLDILTSGGFPLFFTYYTPLFYSLFWLVNNRKRVRGRLNANSYSLWCCGVSFLSLKLMYDFTWTTYFEYFMVFTVIFSIY
ncbi:O-antigen ligase family protein, partial [Photobacterium profundum]